MKLRARAVVCLSVFLLVSKLGAFDGQRKGFTLGVGGGVGFLMAGDFYSEANSSNVSAAANLKIGYAPSNTFEISYTLAASGPFDIYDEGNYFFGVNAISLTYYFNPQGKSLFFTGGIGGAFQSESGDSHGGTGLIVGIGYELGKHWSIQGDVLVMNVRDNYTTIRLTLNFLAF